ncbi:MAG: response regulator transcription factor [Alphaproteobacteria bacterium]|nr:response regulator transcription factor [Alphaproteobacteria bacterium]
MIEGLSYTAHILVIDDDDRIRDLLKKYLEKENFLVSVAPNATDAENLIENIKFDLAIVDKMMPQKNGIDFIKTLRENKNEIPVIMLTAISDTDSKIEGLSTGADDYLSKPFEPKELVLRITNILKRIPQKNANKNIFYFSNYEYNIDTGILKKEDKSIKLTDSEKTLLNFFISKPLQIISRNDIALLLDIKDERGVDVIITRLRKKIEPNIKTPECILTIRNKGYKFIV